MTGLEMQLAVTLYSSLILQDLRPDAVQTKLYEFATEVIEGFKRDLLARMSETKEA